MMLEATPNVDFYQEMVTSLLLDGERVCGVRTSLGINIRSRAVILTNGTFLNGLIHIGDKQFGGGRAGEKAATGITEQLVSLGFSLIIAGWFPNQATSRLNGFPFWTPLY